MDFERYRIQRTDQPEAEFPPSQLDQVVKDFSNSPKSAFWEQIKTKVTQKPSADKTEPQNHNSPQQSDHVLFIRPEKSNQRWIYVLAFITCLCSVLALVLSIVLNLQVVPWLWSR